MTRRLKKLTAQHRGAIPAHVAEWTRIGLCTDPADRPRAEAAIRECYRLSGMAEPRTFVWSPSPIVTALAGPTAATVIVGLRQRGEKSAVNSAVDSEVYLAVRSAVRSAVYSAVYSAVGSAVRSEVDSAVDSAVRSAIKSAWNRYIGGQFWASWAAYTSFFDRVCGLRHAKLVEARAYERALSHCGWWWPHKEFCICTERPSTIRLASGQLHADGKPAVEYDGWSVWALHGVRVPRWLAEQRDSEIDPRKFSAIDNAEVRREFVRKVGIERIISATGAKSLDKRGEYELLQMRVGDERWTYLKMLNPSIGTWHVEGVDNRCRTVVEALNFRKPPKLRALAVDDENGSDWYQQGDVCIWPSSARSIKTEPVILT